MHNSTARRVLAPVFLFAASGMTLAQQGKCQTRLIVVFDKDISESQGTKFSLTAVNPPDEAQPTVSESHEQFTSPGRYEQVVAEDQPKTLYTPTRLTVTTPGGTSAEAVFLTIWPCNIEPQILAVAVSARDGSAASVSELWASEGAKRPENAEDAAVFYARAMAIAEARYGRHGKHQYDLIASYLALRQFLQYVRKSEAPVVMGRRLHRIAAWYDDLKDEVSHDNLSAIDGDTDVPKAELLALFKFYKSIWDRVVRVSSERPVEALEYLRHFRTSLETEERRVELLSVLGLTRSQIEATGLFLAGKIDEDSLKDAAVLDLVTNQLSETEKFVKTFHPTTADSLGKDIVFVRAKVSRIQ